MFDRWDICNAYFMYAMLWGHDSYTRGIERRLDEIGYRPRGNDEYLERMTPNAKAIFGALERRRHGDLVAYDRLHRRHPDVFPAWPGTNAVGSVRRFLQSMGLERALEVWT